MASNQILALPSTSRASLHTNMEEIDKNNVIAMRCLNVIEKIASKLKSDGKNDFVGVVQKIIAVIEDPCDRDSKYDLIDKIMSNIMEAKKEELVSIRDDFRKIFCRREIKKLWVDNSAIVRKEIIGIGEFLTLKRGFLRRPDGTTTEVAIRRMNDIQYKDVIENEASVMSQLNHKNILKVLAVNKSEPEIVLEYMDLGCLIEAVERVNFTDLNLLRILNDVASGMEYLHGKKYLHRHLSCLTVYLNSKKKCKIGDFGLSVYLGDSEAVYEKKMYDLDDHNACPETLLSNGYTMANDVWAMGILCWELFYIMENANKIPPSMITKKVHFQKFRFRRVPLPKPNRCPDTLYEYINSELLNMNPKMRPTFPAIKEKIKEIVSSLK